MLSKKHAQVNLPVAAHLWSMKERGTDQNLPHVKLAEGGLCHRIEGVAAVPNRNRLVAKSSLVSWHRKGRRRMINARLLALTAILAGVSILCGSAQAQNALLTSSSAAQGGVAPAEVNQTPNRPATAPSAALQHMPRATPRAVPQGKSISVEDLLSAITLSDEQKPRIDQVRKDMRARMDRVAHDQNENADQKNAMLQGLQRMEVRQVYLLLTPDQRIEVRNKIAAQRAADQQPQKVQPESRPK